METPPSPSPREADIASNPAGTVYTIETVERITRITRDRIVLYYRWGLVSTVATPDETNLLFDDAAIHRLRRIAFLATEYGINAVGLQKLSQLMDEVERLREEVRFLRAKG